MEYGILLHQPSQQDCELQMNLPIYPFTDTAAIFVLSPGHPIVLIKIYYNFFCSDNAALSQ